MIAMLSIRATLSTAVPVVLQNLDNIVSQVILKAFLRILAAVPLLVDPTKGLAE